LWLADSENRVGYQGCMILIITPGGGELFIFYDEVKYEKLNFSVSFFLNEQSLIRIIFSG